MTLDPIEHANAAAIIRLVSMYLDPQDAKRRTWEVNGVVVYGNRTSNRSAVPSDATTFVYRFDAPDWVIMARAVWRSGTLHKPLAVHTTVLSYGVQEGEPQRSQQDLARAANEWLREVLP